MKCGFESLNEHKSTLGGGPPTADPLLKRFNSDNLHGEVLRRKQKGSSPLGV